MMRRDTRFGADLSGWPGFYRALIEGTMLAGAVALPALIGLTLFRAGSIPAVFWPANALPLAVLLVRRPRSWRLPAVAAFASWTGIACADLVSGGSALQAATMACADSVELAAAVGFAWLPFGPRPSLRRTGGHLKIGLAVALVGPLFGACAAATFWWMAGHAWSFAAWNNWFVIHAFGNLIATTVALIVLVRSRGPILPRAKRLQASVIALAGLAGVFLAFRQTDAAPLFLAPFLFAGAGMIGGLRCAALAVAALGSLALSMTALGDGPLAAMAPAGSVIPMIVAQAGLCASFAAALPMVLAFERRGRMIAQLRQQKAAIRSRANRFRAIAEIAADTILVTSPEGVILYASPAAERLIGVSGAALAGRSVFDLIHPDDRQAVSKTMAGLSGETREVTAELRLRHPGTAKPVWAEVKTRIGEFLPERKVELVSVVRDISARRIVQERREADLRRLDRLANMDPLTNLANRRRFNDHLDIEWRRALRENNDIALILIDVDHFKSYNDRYGHPAGDIVLRQIASVAECGTMRPTDLAARIGGEEFAIVLPATFLSGARAVAERVREGIRDLQIVHEKGLKGTISVSIGIDCLRPDTKNSPNTLIERADTALYQAKVKRGSIVVAS